MDILGILFIVLPMRAAAAIYAALFAVVGYIGIRWHQYQLSVISYCDSIEGRLHQLGNGAGITGCGLAVFGNIAAWALTIAAFVVCGAFVIGLIYFLRHPRGGKRLEGFIEG